MNTKLYSLVGGLMLVGLFGFGASASALTYTGMTPPVVKSNTGTFTVPTITVQCSSANEISADQTVRLGIEATATGSAGTGISPLSLDESVTETITVQNSGATGGAIQAPPRLNNGEWSFLVTEGCSFDHRFSISGIKVLVGNSGFSGTAKMYVKLSNGTKYYGNAFVVDTITPKITSARITPTTGTPTELVVTYSEPVYALNTGVMRDVLVHATKGSETQTITLSSFLSTNAMSSGTATNELRFALPASSFINEATQWQVQAVSGGGILDYAGNAVSAVELATFTRTVVTPFTVTDVYPTSGSTVAAKTPIVVNFSTAVNPATFAPSFSPSFGYTFAFSNNNTRLTMTPSSQLDGTSYQITVIVKDASGNALQGNLGTAQRWSYSTTSATVLPTVTSYSPSNNSTKTIGTALLAAFSKPMDTSYVVVSSGTSMNYTAVWSNNNQILTLVLTNELADRNYSVNLSVRSAQGEALSHVWNYTTPATVVVGDPAVSILIQNGASETNTVEVSANVYLTNADQVEYGFKTDLSDSTGFITASNPSTKTFRLPPNNGYATICARARNLSNGRISGINCDTITVVKGISGAPYNQYVLINSGNSTTANRAVTLQLGAVNATQMAVSNLSDFSDTYWESYNTTKSFTLTSGNGTKRVYVQFMGSDGRVSSVAQTSITLEGDSAYVVPSGSITINNGASTTDTTNVTLTFSGVNAQEYQIGTRSDLSDASAYQTYYATHSWTLRPLIGYQQVCVRFRTTATGATSGITCDSIELRPFGSNYPQILAARIGDGSSVTTSRTVSLYLSISNARWIAFSNTSDFSAASWETYGGSRSWELSGGNGQKTIYYIVSNDSGTVTDVRALSVTLQDANNNPTPTPTPNPLYKGPTDVRTLPSGIYAGMLVKREGKAYPAVYYIGRNGYRYSFPNQSVFYSWYTATDLQATNKGGKVVSIAAETLASMQLGGNVTYRPGTKLAKFTTVPKVYAIEKGGVLRWIVSEALAKELYGAQWAKMVAEIDDTLYADYNIQTDITSVSAHNPSFQQTISPDFATDHGLPY